MKIVDRYEIDGALICTVELEEDVFLDVKRVGNLFYAMSCEDGYEVYNSDGNSFDYYYNAADVLQLVIADASSKGNGI